MAEFSGISSHFTFEEENQDPQAIQQQQPQQADSQQSAPASSNIIPSPEPPLSSFIYKTDPDLKFMQMYIPMGYDISELLQNYARENRVGVRVLNGMGNITHFSLIHPPTDTLTGEYTLFGMSGTYVDASLYNNSIEGGISSLPRGRNPWLTVLMTNNSGRLYDGIVHSSVLAATNVVLEMQTFMSGGFYRMDIEQLDGGQHTGAPGGGSSDSSDVGGGFAGNNNDLGGGGLTKGH